MPTMHLTFLLDFFQPTPQSDAVIDEVARECYQPLVELFNCDLNPKFTVSLPNSLADRLEERGRTDVIRQLRQAINAGKVELIHTGAYHPIFPLIPPREVKRQIELDLQYKAKHFGIDGRTGVYAPELCYDDSLLPLFADMGFKWTIIDDAVMPIHNIDIPDQQILRANKISVFMRSSLWSNRISSTGGDGGHLNGRDFVRSMQNEIAEKGHDCYKVIALSGETFGHHIKYYQETFLRDMLFELMRTPSVRLCLVSDLLRQKTLAKKQKNKEQSQYFQHFPPSSSATKPESYRPSHPYPQWKAHDNVIHAGLWKLADMIFNACANIEFEDGTQAQGALRRLLDSAFYCTLYRSASAQFWEPEEIYAGIDLEMRALYSCVRLTNNLRLLDEGQALYKQLVWDIYAYDQNLKL